MLHFIHSVPKLFTTYLPTWLVYVVCGVVWLLMHVSILHYGADNLPYHHADNPDERSPAIGALTMLEERNPFAISDTTALYYGPLFAVLSVPAVVVDYTANVLQTGSFAAADYKNHILYDWGLILTLNRFVAITVSYLGLVALYLILTTTTVNRTRSTWLPLIGVSLLAVNYFYFSYGSLFRHWIFILVPVIWQLYFLIRMQEQPTKAMRYFVYQAGLFLVAFGVNYPAILSQVLLWPILTLQLKLRDVLFWKGFAVFTGLSVIIGGLLVAWYPNQAMRYLGILTSDTLGLGVNKYSITSSEPSTSFGYYIDVLINNHYALLVLLIVLGWSAWRQGVYRSYLYTIILPTALVGAIYLLLAGFHPINVARYALPSIMMLTIVVAVLFVSVYGSLSRLWKTIVTVLVAFHLGFHAISIGFWIGETSDDLPLRPTISEILETHSVAPDTRVLMVNTELLGWPHTTGAYARYAVATGQADRPLFMGYVQSISPPVPLLDVDYVTSLSSKSFSDYDVVYWCQDPSRDGMLYSNYSEIDLVRSWTHDRYWQSGCYGTQLQED